MRRAGFDIGGTFTDLVLWDDEAGEVVIHKLPSTPEDPAKAGLRGLTTLLEKAGRSPGEVDFLVHGTTVATNILLEKNGAKVGMITTEGFRDVLHIGRKNRPFNFSHSQDVPRQSSPLIKRRHRIPVSERIAAPDGAVLKPLDEQEVRDAVARLSNEEVEAVAICCLMSFLNPEHERRIAEIVREEFPAAFVSTSHEVTPLYREYERFSTTALNAYVGPKTARYFQRLTEELGGHDFQCDLNLMTSAGGLVPASEAQKTPVSLLLSGPVGALIAGIQVGNQIGQRNVITLDVGGTSADIGVAPDGLLRMKHLLDTQVGDYDAMMPMVDIDTIGAGGGSIAYRDEGGMFRVGPQSAGAIPGPACYQRGGTKPTVTDAMVVLGWFREKALERSGLTIEPAMAIEAIETHIADPLGMDLLSAAAGIYRIAANNMVEAIRVNSVAKGFDPRDFALLAYGGAGAAFVVEAASQLAIPTAVVPPMPGVGAAAGLLATDTRFEYRKTLWEALDGPDMGRISDAYTELERKATKQLTDSGFAPSEQGITHLAECRYFGQGYELTVSVPAGPINEGWVDVVRAAFHDAHRQSYLRSFEDKPVMIVNVGLVGIGRVTPLKIPTISAGNESVPTDAIIDRRKAHFVEQNKAMPYDTPFIDRSRLRAGNQILGPAVVEQSDTTTILPAKTVTTVDGFGNLIVTVQEAPDD